jgi:hypothetical protein
MVMRYFGGGIGHLKNTPPQQVPGFEPIDPSSEEMEVEDEDDNDDPCIGTNEDLGTIVTMNGGDLEVREDDEDDKDDEDDEEDTSDDDEDEDQTDGDEDEDSGGEDDYGYASP